MKKFDIPEFYRSPIIGKVKNLRKRLDPRKKDFTPTVLNFGSVNIILPRHFGFCYGVENAIEIAYKALLENEGKQIYLLSQMIHNQAVNDDLTDRGICFLMDTYGRQLISFDVLKSDDIVIVPAFGTTVEIEQILEEKGIEVQRYNTTCPFVEKVWNRSSKLGDDDYTIVIHGKPFHEETRATFSHARTNGHAIVIADHQEAELLGRFISGEKSLNEFTTAFGDRCSEGFDPFIHLERIGVVNQTTMLASDTQGIADYLKQVILRKYGEAQIAHHFADTRDTLCYATNDNQQATLALFHKPADLAIVVGGYNSSNTTHLVELCEQNMPTLFIQSEDELLSPEQAKSFDIHSKQLRDVLNWLPQKAHPNIVVTSGASCPDSIVDRVISRVLSFFSDTREAEPVLEELESAMNL